MKKNAAKLKQKTTQIAEAISNPKMKAIAARPVYKRLWNYYCAVGNVLAGTSAMSSVFPNTSDIGMRREWAYAEFLKNHLPSICDVFFGGFLFNLAGEESKQMDVIVTSNLSQRYFVPDQGKSLSCIEGTIAAVCLKSTLNTAELEDSLLNIASIPDFARPKPSKGTDSAEQNYDVLPAKIVYAPQGMKAETLYAAVLNFYKKNPNVPRRNWPDIIHVNKKCIFLKTAPGADIDYLPMEDEDGALGLVNAVYLIQDRLLTASKMRFAYIETLVPLIQQHSGKTIFNKS